jgi:hypothetical protein
MEQSYLLTWVWVAYRRGLETIAQRLVVEFDHARGCRLLVGGVPVVDKILLALFF